MFNNDQLSRVEAKLDRLLSRLPPDDSPFRDNLQCHLRSNNVPCRCIFWLQVMQLGGDGRAPELKEGCAVREMYPHIMNGAIYQANRAAMEATAARQDVQDLTQIVAESKQQAMEQLSRGLAAAAAVPRLVSGLGLSQTLGVEIVPTRLINSANIEQVPVEVSAESD